MSPEELLGLARGGDLDALGAERGAVADAVGAFAEAGDPAAALELVGRAWRIWFSRGELDEGSAVATTALGAPGAKAVPIWRVRVLYADGLFAFRSGDQPRSLARNEEALRVARETDDVRGEPPEHPRGPPSRNDMKRLSVVLVALVAAGCSGASDDFEVPLVCSPEHEQSPCASGVERGIDYTFNLLTHCGIEWAYFDGRYWVAKPKVDPPSDWASIEAGTISLEQPDVAVFEADEGGGARFVPAPRSYRPPTCA